MFGADSSVVLRLEKRVRYMLRDRTALHIYQPEERQAYLCFALDTVALNGCYVSSFIYQDTISDLCNNFRVARS